MTRTTTGSGNRSARSEQRSAPGFIAADCLYTLSEVKARLKLGDAALRRARRDGLKVRQIGRQRYLLGRDILEYVEASSS